MNVVLIGYRGSGKSTIGRRLATRLQMKFVDTDNLIEEHHGVLIRDIVESYGWDYFRAMEKQIIKEVSNQDHLVIAPGGGAVLEAENVTALKRNGLMIWLKADKEAIRKRIEQDPRAFVRRPSLTGKGVLEELEEVIAYREPFYKRAAGVEIDTSNLDVEAVVEAVLLILQERIGRV
jgi:shikimate kinase